MVISQLAAQILTLSGERNKKRKKQNKTQNKKTPPHIFVSPMQFILS